MSAKTENRSEEPSHRHTVAHVIGEVVWLMSQTKEYRSTKVGDLEWMVMPALLLKQFKIFYGDKDHLVGFACWAMVSLDVEGKIKSAVRSQIPVRLEKVDWISGDQPYLIEFISPYASQSAEIFSRMIADLKVKVFGDKPFRFVALDKKFSRDN